MAIKIEVTRKITVDGKDAEFLLIACKMALYYAEMIERGAAQVTDYQPPKSSLPEVLRVAEQIVGNEQHE